MTAVSLPQAPAGVAGFNRIFHAARLHAANPWGTLVLPWLIYAGVFGLTYVIWVLIANAAGGRENIDPAAFTYAGGGFWVLIYMMVVAVQAMNLTFRFALGLSLSRREYYLGTAGYFLALSVLYGTGITLAAVIERATDGWGMNGAFFAPFFMTDDSLLQVWFVWITLFLFFFFVGAAVAAVYVRWGSNGLISFFAIVALLLVGAAWLTIEFEAGAQIVEFFVRTSTVQIAAYSVVVSAACAVVGFLLLRRATPKA